MENEVKFTGDSAGEAKSKAQAFLRDHPDFGPDIHLSTQKVGKGAWEHVATVCRRIELKGNAK